MLNEDNQIHNIISSSDSGTVINYGSGSTVKKLRFLRFRFWFRFHNAALNITFGCLQKRNR
jgi:hypothetical protein